MFKFRGIIIFVVAIVFVFISIRATFPPPVHQEALEDSAFSVKKAYTHLSIISKYPHSSGTLQQANIRNFIKSRCEEMGFQVWIQQSTSINSRKANVQAANISNIIALKKGTLPGKTVLLMAHYDSEPNTGGAGDNGAAVAAILETARALQFSSPLRNDLLLLFTDAEEIGLLGARAFVDEYEQLDNIGIVLNFEGRGNAGPSNMFEVNAQNGWAIKEFAKSAAHPFANSLGYEVYKNLPNITDFTVFKDASITGLNNAFIDGFANYHSMNDKPENLDLRSFQHHGENMLSLARHFGNLEIISTKAPDISYFNLIGHWLVYYPASLNIVFVILANIIFGCFVFSGIKRKKITLVGLAFSTFVFPLLLALIYFTASFSLKKILAAYPLYTHFEENNSYNAGWYFLAMTSLSVFVVSMFYWMVARKIKSYSLYAGVLLNLVLLMNLLQFIAPSASYLLFIPLLIIVPIQIYSLRSGISIINAPAKWDALNLAGSIPSILLLSSILYYSFVAFALGPNMPFVAVGVGLVTGLLLPIIFPGLNLQTPWVGVAAILLFISSLVIAHMDAGYSPARPLPSSVYYALDLDSSRANWRSDFRLTDKFSERFLKNNQTSNGNGKTGITGEAPFLALEAPVAALVRDSVVHDTRKVTLHFKASRQHVNRIGIEIRKSSLVGGCRINGKPVTATPGINFRYIIFTAIENEGFKVDFDLPRAVKLNILVTEASQGLPIMNGSAITYPEDIIPAQGKSNTTQVSKSFIF